MLAPPVLSSKAKEQLTPRINGEVLEQTGITSRDYTNGDGLRVVRALLEAGATVVESVTEAVEAAKKSAILAETQE